MAAKFEFLNDWQTALQECRSQLKPEEIRRMSSVTSYEDLQSSVAILEKDYRKRRIAKVLSRIEPYLSNLRSFQGVVDTAVQAKPDLAALMWGGIKLVLEVIVKGIHCFST